MSLGNECKYSYRFPHVTCVILFQKSPQSEPGDNETIDRVEVVFTNSRYSWSKDFVLLRFFARSSVGTFVFDEPVLLKTDGLKQQLEIVGDMKKAWRFPPYYNTEAKTVTQYKGYDQNKGHESIYYHEYKHAKFGLGINIGEVSQVNKISLHVPVRVNNVPITMDLYFDNELYIQKVKNKFGIPGMP